MTGVQTCALPICFPVTISSTTIPQIRIIEVKDGKHLWVGEPFVYRVLTEIVSVINPARLPLQTEF